MSHLRPSPESAPEKVLVEQQLMMVRKDALKW